MLRYGVEGPAASSSKAICASCASSPDVPPRPHTAATHDYLPAQNPCNSRNPGCELSSTPQSIHRRTGARLTMAGLGGRRRCSPAAPPFTRSVVARIVLRSRPHPNADKLRRMPGRRRQRRDARRSSAARPTAAAGLEVAAGRRRAAAAKLPGDIIRDQGRKLRGIESCRHAVLGARTEACRRTMGACWRCRRTASRSPGHARASGSGRSRCSR